MELGITRSLWAVSFLRLTCERTITNLSNTRKKNRGAIVTGLQRVIEVCDLSRDFLLQHKPKRRGHGCIVPRPSTKRQTT
jgi:hypothetical protein